MLFFIGFIGLGVQAQDADEALAAQYYQNGEYQKAIDLYSILYAKKPESKYIYTNYLQCFIALAQYDKALALAQKQSRRFPGNMGYKVDRPWILQKRGDDKGSEKARKELLKELKTVDQAYDLSMALLRREYVDDAIEALLIARKESKEENLFAEQLTRLYAQKGENKKVIDEAYKSLEENPQSATNLQNLLQLVLDEEDDWTYLKKKLQQGISANPHQIAFNELLMWALVQQKQFYAAFIQFRALDKRLNENGRRLMDLAEMSMTNGDFDNAVRCYEYVIDLGNRMPYYFRAQFGLLRVQYNRITKYRQYDSLALRRAINDYHKFIHSNEGFFQVEFAQRELAELYNFYLDKPDSAILLLQAIINNPRAEKHFKGQVKLELGDSYIVQGDVWEAELLYSQVDKDFKEEALGQEAKFRMARLFYFKGEFERSRAYLDVLKTATTQLISNNAIDLGMLILDNTGLDTSEEAMMLYAEAELLIYRNKFKAAEEKLQEIESRFAKHPLTDEILFARAQIGLKQQNSDTALYFFEKIISEHGADILADNALFALANLYHFQKQDLKKAQELYEKLLLNYPSSLFVVEARKRYRALRGDKPDTKENKQIMFDYFTN